MRSFDLRQLDHSTILFESSSNAGRTRGTPLLRLAFNPNDANSVAIIHANCPYITILDVRSPGIAVAELKSHQGAINGIAWWGGHDENAMLASVSDDAQVLLWDLAHTNAYGERLPRQLNLPSAAYTAPGEVNAVAWGSGREYLATGLGNGSVRCVRV